MCPFFLIIINFDKVWHSIDFNSFDNRTMETNHTVIKSIILYDPLQNVCGFVELRTLKSAYNKTQIKATHNFESESPNTQIILSLVTSNSSFAFTMDGTSSSFLVDKALDLESEIFVNLMRKVDGFGFSCKWGYKL